MMLIDELPEGWWDMPQLERLSILKDTDLPDNGRPLALEWLYNLLLIHTVCDVPFVFFDEEERKVIMAHNVDEMLTYLNVGDREYEVIQNNHQFVVDEVLTVLATPEAKLLFDN